MRREFAFCTTKARVGACVRAPAVWRARESARGRRCASGRMPALIFWLLLGLAFAPASPQAAPITGETQPEFSAPLALQDPAAPASRTGIDAGADATVIEFSIIPSASDPNKMETVIIVQQKGGKDICLNQSTSDIISRSYLRRGDEPFDPAVPNEIRGLSSGDTGELVGFNDIKVFIRPNSSADEFIDTDECFQVAEVEACFVGDVGDCDQALQEGDFICVGDSISNSGCPVADHTDLMRRLRIMVALNQPLGETPIITAADISTAPELSLPNGEPGAPGGGTPPAGPAPPEGPTADPPFTGSGGGPNLITVPNVIGMTLAEASGVITAATLVVGNVTTQGQQTGLSLPGLIRTAPMPRRLANRAR